VQLHVLSATDLRTLLDMPLAIDAMRAAFTQLSSGEASVPVRTVVEAGAVSTLVMPGFLPRPGALGAKVVSVAAGNRTRGLPVVHAAVVLVEVDSGRPLALLEGTWLTALRTGAASGLATELLARPDARVLAVIGAGAQARTQIEAVCAVRDIDEVRVASRTRASAERLAAELEGVVARVCTDADGAVAGADVVVTATDSRDPVFGDDRVAPGTHVNAIGSFTPGMRELPRALLGRSRVVVDQIDAALAEAGEVIDAVRAGVLGREALVELGAVAAGREPGREARDQVTVFKSVGSAAQDLVLAARAVTAAMERGVGRLVDLD
jgi:ornithine cyclodeaminase/alanine dehydrogenase-like protein (mu-crystallin family)